MELSRDERELLRSYANGPRVWDATEVFARVLELQERGLVTPEGEGGRYALTDAGRATLNESNAVDGGESVMVARPYMDPTTDEWVGEHEVRLPDGDVRRQTEWFATEAEAWRFARHGKANESGSAPSSPGA